MADRSDAADREAGRIADEIRIGAAHVRSAEHMPHLSGVDLVVAAGEHEHRGAVSGEHQRLDDRADGDVECVGCIDRRAGRFAELVHVGPDAAGTKRGHHPFDAWMHDRHVSAVGKVRAMTDGVEPAENRLIRLLAIVLLAGAGVRLLAAVVAGFIEWGHSSFPGGEPGRARAFDVLATFGTGGDGAGIVIAVIAMLVVWRVSRTEEPLAPTLRLAACWILGITAVLAVLETIGISLVFNFDINDQVSRLVQSAGFAFAALVIAGGGIVLTRQYGLMLDERSAADDLDAFVFAVDRHSIDVRAFFSARDAIRRMHLYTVEEEEFDFYTDEGEVLTASVVDGHIELRPTGELRLDELLGRLKEFVLRRGISVDEGDADEPTAYVDPINKWQWLEMWPPWMRPLGYLFRRR